jgi:CubicO group peptidase (beta-lactamase class C family)
MVGLLQAPRPGCVADASALQNTVRQVHDKQRNVGVSVAAMRGGTLVFSYQLGLADLEHEVPVTPQTLFGIASVTKAFTGITLLRLAEHGKIDLDAPLQRYVPSFPERPEGPITIRRLLAHLSGLPHPTERTPALFATHYATATDAIAFIRDVKLAAAPGTKYIYSSSNYNLIAAAIEGATGRPFTAVVQDEILTPLRLEHTRFDDALHPVAHRSRRYSFYHPWTYEESTSLFVIPRWDYSFNVGGGGLLSTAEDLVRFGSALLHPGLLSADSLQRLQSRTVLNGVESAWSFGLIVAPATAPKRRLSISGSNPGVQASLALWPDDDLVVAVVANTWGIGSRSAEMVDLVDPIANACTGR